MIEATRLRKTFGTVEAVRSVSLTVSAGEAVGFLGPNGAGKTTTFRMLAGSLGPTEGRVTIGGVSLSESPKEAKRLIGYMPEAAPLYPEMNVGEYLAFRAELKGLTEKTARRNAIHDASSKTRILDVSRMRIGHLSKGYRQRVALAEALLTNPPVLLLDEPTAGLDPNQVLEVRALIRQLAETQAVLISTHVLSEVEATCSRAIVLNQGVVVGEGPLSELKERSGLGLTRIRVRGPLEAAAKLLQVDSLPNEPGTFRLALDPDGRADAARRLIEAGVELVEMTSESAALDEVFRSLTAKEGQP